MFDVKEFLAWCYEYKKLCDEEASNYGSYENECYAVAMADVIRKVEAMTKE